MEASFLYTHHECRIFESENYKNSDEAKERMSKIHNLFRQVPTNVRRYAGRRIPIEKYFCEKLERYEETRQMVFPAAVSSLGLT